MLKPYSTGLDMHWIYWIKPPKKSSLMGRGVTWWVANLSPMALIVESFGKIPPFLKKQSTSFTKPPYLNLLQTVTYLKFLSLWRNRAQLYKTGALGLGDKFNGFREDNKMRDWFPYL